MGSTPVLIGLFATVGICIVSWGGDSSVKNAALVSLGGLAGWAGGVAVPRGHEGASRRYRSPYRASGRSNH